MRKVISKAAQRNVAKSVSNTLLTHPLQLGKKKNVDVYEFTHARNTFLI